MIKKDTLNLTLHFSPYLATLFLQHTIEKHKGFGNLRLAHIEYETALYAEYSQITSHG